MSDIMSILSTAYKSNVLSSTSGSSKYVAVDSSLYQGNWSGTYPDGKTFSLNISQVSGFRAQIHYQSGGTSQYQQGADQGFLVPLRQYEVHADRYRQGADQERRYGPGDRFELSRHRPGHARQLIGWRALSAEVRVERTRGLRLQIQCVEIGSPAQHRLVGELVDQRVGLVVDDLEDHGCSRLVEHDLA